MSIHEAPDENDDDDGLSHSLDFYAKREEPRCVTMLNSDFFLFVYTPFGGEDWEREATQFKTWAQYTMSQYNPHLNHNNKKLIQ